VTYSPPAIDPQLTSERKELTNTEIQGVPYPAPQDFRNALPLLNGVVQDNAGRVHFNGGDTNQANYTLDGFNISDPVTGRLEARINIESIQSMDLEGSRYAADNGRGSTGVLDLKTRMGDDRWRFGGTNFIPGVSAEGGLYVNKWTPRLELSGPIVKGRAWFHNGLDAFYNVDSVHGLPHGENRTSGLSGSNLSRFHVNITPANILTASFLYNLTDTNRNGLSILNQHLGHWKRRVQLIVRRKAGRGGRDRLRKADGNSSIETIDIKGVDGWGRVVRHNVQNSAIGKNRIAPVTDNSPELRPVIRQGDAR